MNSLTKHSYERFPIYINFEGDFVKDEILAPTGYSLTCIDLETGLPATGGIHIADGTWIADGSITGAGSDDSSIIASYLLKIKKMMIVIQAGIAGKVYKLSVKADTNFGNVCQGELLISIVENYIDVLHKTTLGKVIVSFNFVNDFAISELSQAIKTKSVTIKKISDGSDATSAILDDSQSSLNTVLARLQSGDNGESYGITAKVVTDIGYKYSQSILMQVKN